MGLKLSETGTRMYCFETCLFLFVLLLDFHFSDNRTYPPQFQEFCQRNRDLCGQMVLRFLVCVFLCKLNWVSDYFQGFDTFQSCFSLKLKSYVLTTS